MGQVGEVVGLSVVALLAWLLLGWSLLAHAWLIVAVLGRRWGARRHPSHLPIAHPIGPEDDPDFWPPREDTRA